MNRMMRVSGLLWGMLTAVGCGGAEESEPRSEQSLKVERQAATASGWTTTAPMAIGREQAGAALLDSGLVLVTGGTSTFPFSHTELYNPYSNTWQTTGNLSSSRYNFATVKLASGKILVSGGLQPYSTLSGAEVYDPATNSWSWAGSMSKQRYGHKATLLESGKVLVTGGTVVWRDGPVVHGDSATTAELYDPETNTWSSAGDLGFGTADSVPVRLYSGEVMLLSGSRVDIYEPATNSWRYNGSMPGERGLFTATRLYSGEVMVVGGSDKATFIYNPYSNQWRVGPSMNQPHNSHHGHTATLLYSGKLLIAGSGSTEIYDPETNSWSQHADMPADCLTGCTAILLHHGSVLLTAGDAVPAAATATIFTP